MQQKLKTIKIRGQMLKNFFLVLFPSPLLRWARLVEKKQAKNSHAWAPLTKDFE
jgi:hypothetical protein